MSKTPEIEQARHVHQHPMHGFKQYAYATAKAGNLELVPDEPRGEPAPDWLSHNRRAPVRKVKRMTSVWPPPKD